MSASLILKEKWRMAFHWSKDEYGNMSIEILYALGRRHTELFNVSTKEQEDNLLSLARLLECAVMSRYGNDKLTVNEDEFLEALAHLYQINFKSFYGYCHRYFNAVFDVMDDNKDGFISWDEFKTYYQRRDVALPEGRSVIFNTLDANGDGQLSRQEYVDAYLAYFTDQHVSHEQLALY